MIRAFGQDSLRMAAEIALAPPHAARQGFTPGHLYVVHYDLPRYRQNSAAVVEFTPAGQFVRSFCGAAHGRVRMEGSHSLAFHPDGRLLVAEERGILAFSEGGAAVQRFRDHFCTSLYVGAQGEIYKMDYSSIGCLIEVVDANGRRLRAMGPTAPGVFNGSLVVDARGQVFTVRHQGQDAEIVVFDAQGNMLRSFPAPRHAVGIALDPHERLHVACPRAGMIHVLSSEGHSLERIDLRRHVLPWHVAFGPNGRRWVVGYTPSKS
jgi:hypothetical protein